MISHADPASCPQGRHPQPAEESAPTAACMRAGTRGQGAAPSGRRTSFSAGARTKAGVQHAHQFTNPSTATWRRWIAFEHLHDDRRRTMHRSLNVFDANARIVAGDEFGCSCRVSAGSENVLDLSVLRQGMQVGGACRRHRRPSCLSRSRGVRALGCLEGRPRCVTQRLPSLTAPGELPCGADGVSRPRVARLIGLEYLEHHFRARRSERGDLTKVLLAQSNLALVPCHRSILDHCEGQQGGRGLPGCCRRRPSAGRPERAGRPRAPQVREGGSSPERRPRRTSAGIFRCDRLEGGRVSGGHRDGAPMTGAVTRNVQRFATDERQVGRGGADVRATAPSERAVR